MSNQSPKNRAAIVIGAGGALGSAISTKLASEGCKVILAGRSFSKLESVAMTISKRTPSSTVFCLELDLTDDGSVKSFCDEVQTLQPETDVVINCAAGFFKGPIDGIDAADLRKLLDANFCGPVLLTNTLLPMLKRNAPSDVVHVTSISSATNLDTSRSSVHHIASKAALGIFGSVAARELAVQGVRLTTMAPGTLAKGEREGLSIPLLAEMVFSALNLHPSLRLESLIVAPTGWKT